jgi:site-specific recombinase XerD
MTSLPAAGNPRIGPITTNQYRRFVQGGAASAQLDPHHFRPHSLRRPQAALVYQQPPNVEAVRQLLGQASLTAPAAYLGIDQPAAWEIARQCALGLQSTRRRILACVPP